MTKKNDYSVARALAASWWLVLLRGVSALLFGGLAFAMPRLTLVALITLFGIYVVADGLMALMSGVRERAWPMLLLGLLGLWVGIYTFLNPGTTAVLLLYVISAWAIARGLFEIVAAVHLRKFVTNEWFLALSGVLSIAFGALLLLNPGAGALAMVWLIGSYGLLFGILLIVLAFRLRGLPQKLEKMRQAPRDAASGA